MAVIKDISHDGGQTSGTLSGNVRIDESKGQLVAFNGSNNIGLFGFDSTGRVVVKVAKDGYDAETATDDQLIFNSNQNVFQIVGLPLTVSFSFTSSGSSQGGGIISIYHNLGYVPLTESTVQITTDWNGLPGIFPIPYFVPGRNSASGAFIIASYVRVSKVTASRIEFDVGVIAGGSTISGQITVYVKKQSAI